MFSKYLPTMSALALPASGLWVIHPSTSTTFIMAGCVGAAVVESAIRKQMEAHQERQEIKAEVKAAKVAAKAARKGYAPVVEPTALPPANGTVIDYTAAANAQQLRRLG